MVRMWRPGATRLGGTYDEFPDSGWHPEKDNQSSKDTKGDIAGLDDSVGTVLPRVVVAMQGVEEYRVDEEGKEDRRENGKEEPDALNSRARELVADLLDGEDTHVPVVGSHERLNFDRHGRWVHVFAQVLSVISSWVNCIVARDNRHAPCRCDRLSCGG
jgi:hypothetical protein